MAWYVCDIMSSVRHGVWHGVCDMVYGEWLNDMQRIYSDLSWSTWFVHYTSRPKLLSMHFQSNSPCLKDYPCCQKQAQIRHDCYGNGRHVFDIRCLTVPVDGAYKPWAPPPPPKKKENPEYKSAGRQGVPVACHILMLSIATVFICCCLD